MPLHCFRFFAVVRDQYNFHLPLSPSRDEKVCLLHPLLSVPGMLLGALSLLPAEPALIPQAFLMGQGLQPCHLGGLPSCPTSLSMFFLHLRQCSLCGLSTEKMAWSLPWLSRPHTAPAAQGAAGPCCCLGIQLSSAELAAWLFLWSCSRDPACIAAGICLPKAELSVHPC